MHDSVIGAEVKIARAQAHLETVEGEINRVVGKNAYETRPHPNPECTEYSFTVEGLKPLRNDLSAIVGDLLHNLRSALDHLAHGLIDVAGSQPTQSTMFPLLLSPPSGPLLIKGNLDIPAPQEVVDLQPYSTRKDTVEPLPAVKKPLAILNELNITDKHKRLLFSVVQFRHAGWFEGDKPGVISARTNPDPLKDGDELVVFQFREPHRDFDPNIALYIKLDERELPSKRMRAVLTTRPLHNTLTLLLHAVENIALPRLRALLT